MDLFPTDFSAKMLHSNCSILSENVGSCCIQIVLLLQWTFLIARVWIIHKSHAFECHHVIRCMWLVKNSIQSLSYFIVHSGNNQFDCTFVFISLFALIAVMHNLNNFDCCIHYCINQSWIFTIRMTHIIWFTASKSFFTNCRYFQYNHFNITVWFYRPIILLKQWYNISLHMVIYSS